MSYRILIIVGLMIAAVVISIIYYPKMPDRMASHWNPAGEVDGYMPKDLAVWIAPGVMVLVSSLLFLFMVIDPLRKNVASFRKYIDWLVVFINLFMLVIHMQMILWSLGTRISPNIIMPFAMGGLFFYIGILCDNVKPNWFAGIRTPWTLSSEAVWRKTHRLGGILFKISGIICLFGAAFGKYAVAFILVPVLTTAAVTIIYSYIIYRKQPAE